MGALSRPFDAKGRPQIGGPEHAKEFTRTEQAEPGFCAANKIAK